MDYTEEEKKNLKSIEVTVFSKNGSLYRTLLREATKEHKPMLPYLGITLTDITFEENKANKIDGLINFLKKESLARHIKLILGLQKFIHNYKSNIFVYPNIQIHIHHRLPIMPDIFLDEISKKIVKNIPLTINELNYIPEGKKKIIS